MAADQRNLPAFFSSSADFQSWVTGITAQLTACGLTQTADTGQINPATVSLPGTTTTAAGYQIWRFNDSQQAARPVYLKIEYGVGGATTTPEIWLTFGQSSDGAGTINSVLKSPRWANGNTLNSAVAGSQFPSYMSGDGSRWCWVWQYNTANSSTNNGNSGANWAIADRTRDANGNTLSDAVVVSTGSVANSPSGFGQLGVFSAAGYTTFNNAAAGGSGGQFVGLRSLQSNMLWGGGQSSVGANVALMPLMVVMGQPRYLIGGCFYNPTDISAVATIVVNNLGANHTYITLPWVWEDFMSTNPNDGFAILFE